MIEVNGFSNIRMRNLHSSGEQIRSVENPLWEGSHTQLPWVTEPFGFRNPLGLRNPFGFGNPWKASSELLCSIFYLETKVKKVLT